MLRSLALACVVVSVSSSLRASEMQFPYEAMVAGDDVVVRSGPGKNYYATSKLERNLQVIVHRHDPGGWYMISPPPGSISWIEATLVERQGDRGIVNVPADEQGRPGQAVVRIGSTLSDDHGYTGRRLASGDEVEIIGEQTLAMPQGPVRMLQIVPPLREYRWVKGDFIVPADAALRQHADSDPYAIPSHHRGTKAAVAIANTELPPLPSPARKAETKTAAAEEAAPSPAVLASHPHRMQLLEIDNRYADMMALDISQWQPGELRAAYESLKAQVEPMLAAKIDVRLSALAEREKLYENYARFAQVTAATERRDAELLGMVAPAMAQAPSAGMNIAVQGPPAGFMPAAPAAAMSMAMQPPAVQLGAPTNVPPTTAAQTMLSAAPAFAPQQGVMQAGGVNAAGGVMPAGGAASPMARGGVVQASGVQTPAPNNSPFAGAGIVQATNLRGAGLPQFMITAADGRFLAFIESNQVDLRGYVGQSMGLVGPRGHRPQLRADLIQVQSLSPVQLAGR
ncbi:hypothetical protein Pan44_21540 [Caulifigura coniformis]|uniref:Bacterial SH3 domain protein n=1 Tax=Caulifigura coniformis TaxID=2527983 RepID=A0A517SDD8_9PLAN|nr:hypothetical protein [Caulifigura coniformis]QDT54127.1 hypothetical protein Pan44_21540 [Caulifigura coniformis]